MLTEEQRGVLVDDIQNNVDYNYNGYDPQVEVYRFGERFETDHPVVMINFLPSNIKKFQSLGDVIDKAEGDYALYGYCQVVVVGVHCYAQEHHEDQNYDKINGRLICSNMAEQIFARLLRNWEDILAVFGASFDRKQTIQIVDNSYYDAETETQVYNYDIDLWIRTALEWDKVPEGYDPSEEIAESAILEVEEPNDTGVIKNITIRVT